MHCNQTPPPSGNASATTHKTSTVDITSSPCSIWLVTWSFGVDYSHMETGPLVWWKSFFDTPYRRSCKGLAPTKHFISGHPHFGHNCFWGWGCNCLGRFMGRRARILWWWRRLITVRVLIWPSNAKLPRSIFLCRVLSFIFYWFGMVRRKLTIPEGWHAVGMHNGGLSHRRVVDHFRVNHYIIVRFTGK
jgi:hypothetical protein